MTRSSELFNVILRLLKRRYEVTFRDARFDLVAVRLRLWTKDGKLGGEMTIEICEDMLVEALEAMAVEIEKNAERPAIPWPSWKTLEKNEELKRENDRLRCSADISTIIREEIAPHIKAIAASVEARI